MAGVHQARFHGGDTLGMARTAGTLRSCEVSGKSNQAIVRIVPGRCGKIPGMARDAIACSETMCAIETGRHVRVALQAAVARVRSLLGAQPACKKRNHKRTNREQNPLRGRTKEYACIKQGMCKKDGVLRP